MAPGFEKNVVCTIGFCLIRQSSASPIVCFHQSTRFLRLHRRAKALGWLCLGLTSGGGRQLPRFSWPVTPPGRIIIFHRAIKSDSSDLAKRKRLQSGNKVAMRRSLPGIATDFESSASANSATPDFDFELLF
jgi:hypothetical protein